MMGSPRKKLGVFVSSSLLSLAVGGHSFSVLKLKSWKTFSLFYGCLLVSSVSITLLSIQWIIFCRAQLFVSVRIPGTVRFCEYEIY